MNVQIEALKNVWPKIFAVWKFDLLQRCMEMHLWVHLSLGCFEDRTFSENLYANVYQMATLLHRLGSLEFQNLADQSTRAPLKICNRYANSLSSVTLLYLLRLLLLNLAGTIFLLQCSGNLLALSSAVILKEIIWFVSESTQCSVRYQWYPLKTFIRLAHNVRTVNLPVASKLRLPAWSTAFQCYGSGWLGIYLSGKNAHNFGWLFSSTIHFGRPPILHPFALSSCLMLPTVKPRMAVQNLFEETFPKKLFHPDLLETHWLYLPVIFLLTVLTISRNFTKLF